MTREFLMPLLTIFVAGVLANGIWRMAGVVLSSGLSEESALFSWVLAVSRALIAGLVARIILFPPGVLATVAMPVRAFALIFGIVVFYAVRRNVSAGIITATATLILLHLITV